MEFKNILLAIEKVTENEDIILKAKKIADQNKASLTIMQVIEKPFLPVLDVLANKYSIHVRQNAEEHERSEILKLIPGFDANSFQVVVGSPADEIVRNIIENKRDLLLIKAHSHGLADRILGSTTVRLLRKAPCPVWAMQPKLAKEKISKILATIDDAHEDSETYSLNKKIVETAASLAGQNKCKAQYLQAWRHFGEELQKGHWGLSDEVVKEVDKDLHNKHKTRLEQLLKDASAELADEQINLIKGDAGRVIEEFVQDNDIQLLVMGTLSRTGVAGVLVGNTAEKILRKVTCSVLTLKPEGFEKLI